MAIVYTQGNKNTGNVRPGRLLLRFLEPKSLTLEKTLIRLGFSHVPLVLFGLLTQRQTLDFSRSLACLFCRISELAIAAAIASLTVRHRKLSADPIRLTTSSPTDFFMEIFDLRSHPSPHAQFTAIVHQLE